MKWDKLRFVGATNVDLPAVGADPSGPFILKGVEGLDPPPRDVLYANTVEEGGVRQKKRTQNRQIVALVGLQPAWDIGQTSSDLRTQLYGLLTPKYDVPVKVQIMLGNTVLCEGKGDVSNVDASIFSKDPEVQVTLDCDYPYLLKPTVVEQLPQRVVNGGLTTLTVDNDGSAPAGFLLTFTIQQAVAGDLVLSEVGLDGRNMTFSGPFAAGETIIIDTRPHQRKTNRILAGESNQRSILNDMKPGSTWLMLHGGVNQLQLNITQFDWYEQAFAHTPAHWGV